MFHISKIINPKNFIAKLNILKEVIKQLSQRNPKGWFYNSTTTRIQAQKLKDIKSMFDVARINQGHININHIPSKLTEQQKQIRKNLESLLGFSPSEFEK